MNALGAVTDTIVYDSYGNILVETGTTLNPFKYVGRFGYYFDSDTNECLLRSRFYSPALSRFLSRDVLGFDGGDANLYRYVANSVPNLYDPSGMKIVVKVVSVGGCVSTGSCGGSEFTVRFETRRREGSEKSHGGDCTARGY